MLRITNTPQTPAATSNNSSILEFNNNFPGDDDDDDQFRDIHALTPPPPPPPPPPAQVQRGAWDASSRRSSNLSVASDVTNSSENFTSMSREFNALVIAGSTINNDHVNNSNSNPALDRIGEVEEGDHHYHHHHQQHHHDHDGGGGGDVEETNPLAIVPDMNPLPSPLPDRTNHGGASLGNQMMGSTRNSRRISNNNINSSEVGVVQVDRVKAEEVDAKISAWQTAKISKINNRFKREDAIISGWEKEQVHKASSWMKKVERKLEEKRAKAMEKMQNEIAKAHRKAEERRASAEGKRGTKVAKVLQVTNLMRAVGRPPAKRSFF